MSLDQDWFGKATNTCHVPSGPKGGQFCSRGGGSGSKGRVFTGEPIQTKSKPSKLEVGAIGEKIVTDYLKKQGFSDARTTNVKVNNFPVDLLQDHSAIEVKAGLVSNGRSAQHWRATIGQPGKKETKWLKTLSKEKKAAWNEAKNKKILERKQKALNQISQTLGRKVKGQTYTLIINPDTKKADLYKFDGFHLRIPWNSPQAKAGYVTTIDYSKIAKAEVDKGNTCHVPSGPKGGQFCSGGSGTRAQGTPNIPANVVYHEYPPNSGKARVIRLLSDGKVHSMDEIRQSAGIKSVKHMLLKMDEDGVELVRSGKDGWRINRTGEFAKLTPIRAGADVKSRAKRPGVALGPRQPKAPPVSAPPSGGPRIDSDNKHAAMEQGLRSAIVVSDRKLGGGVTETRLVTLSDGTQAVFKPHSGEPNGRMRHNVSPGFQTERETSAWNVAKIVGVDDLVTPAVEKKVKGQRGVILPWQSGKVAYDSPSPFDGEKDSHRAAIFDYVIGNTDRHSGNWLVSPQGKLRLIDHGLSFPDGPGKSGGNMYLLKYHGGRTVSAEDVAPYIKNRSAILESLKKSGLPEGSIKGVSRRLDFLASGPSYHTRSLSDLYEDLAGKRGGL